MTQRPDEDDLIARYFAPLAGAAGLKLIDDVALMTPPAGFDLALTVDALVGGVHFFNDDPPETIARKALRVNLSDLAAKGAKPLGFLLALALPADWTPEWLAEFARGLGEDAGAYGCPLIGGDTVKASGSLTLSITAIGAVPAGRMAARTGAQAGNRLYVSGTIGDAALGLQARLGRLDGLAPCHRAALIDRYLLPRPRLALGDAMAEYAAGGMDVSDGLVGDLIKMMKASGVTATVDLRRVPLSEAARAAMALRPNEFETAITGGDDYEIIAAVAPERACAFQDAAAAAGVAVTEIGGVAAGSAPPRFLGLDGQPRVFARGSYSHF